MTTFTILAINKTCCQVNNYELYFGKRQQLTTLRCCKELLTFERYYNFVQKPNWNETAAFAEVVGKGKLEVSNL